MGSRPVAPDGVNVRLQVSNVCTNSNLPFVLGKVNGELINILADSGAMCSVVHYKVIKGMGLPVRPSSSVLTGVTGAAIDVVGEVLLPLEINGRKFEHNCIVVRGMDYNMIMGYDLMTKQGYILNFSGRDIDQTTSYTACVRLPQEVVIQPRTRRVLQVKPGRRLDNCPEVWVRPEGLKEPGVRVDEALAPVDKEGNLLIGLVNENFHEITLERRTRLAVVEGCPGQQISNICWQKKWATDGPNQASRSFESKDINLKEFQAQQQRKYTLQETEQRVLKVLKDIPREHLSPSQKKVVERLVTRHHLVYALSGEVLPATPLITCKVPTGDIRPIRQRAYRLPECHREPLRKLLKKQIDEGIITPSQSEWSAPLILVPKKDTGELRKVIDYRSLNDAIRKDNYPLPRIDDLIDRVQGAKVFSVFDLKSGYHQVMMDNDDAYKTAFVCSEGLFQYNRMPMGLATAPPTFQRLLEMVLAEKIGHGVLVYIDDVILYSETEEAHEKLVSEVFQLLESAGLSLKASKCQFFKKTVDYLGHELSEGGIRPLRANIRKVMDFPVPRTLKNLRSFVGLATYYRRFVRKFSELVRPLTELTKKNRGFKWGEAQQLAFEKVKNKLMTAPILAYPRYDHEFTLFTDASSVCIGAVLSQVHENLERVISYGSRMLNEAERGYSTTEKECLSVVHFTTEYRHYLLGRKFDIISDHRPLQWLKSIKHPTGRLGRWAIKMSEFDYTIKYRPGRKHENADGMSRRANVIKNNPAATMEPKVLESITIDEFKLKQETDVWCHALLQYIKLRVLPDADDRLAKRVVWEAAKYTISKEGLLMAYPDSRLTVSKAMEAHPVVVVPRMLTKKVIELLHDHLTAGHLGFVKTLHRIQERYVWDGMYTEIEKYTKSCVSCAKVKTPPIARRAPYGQFTEATRVLERIQVDILGPFMPKSNSGDSVILVITDVFSRYVEALPLPDQKTETIADALVNKYFCKYGVCEELHTDNGRNFVSNLMKEVAKLYNITKITGSSYHPSTQGLVEKNNRMILDTLKQYTQTQVRIWADLIPHVVYAYNTSVHSSSKMTPFELMFGRKGRLPTDLVMHRPKPNYNDTNRYVAELTEKMYLSHKDARNNSRLARAEQEKYYNLKAKKRRFEVGNYVFITNERKKAKRKNKDDCRKLRLPWLGPCQIVKQISDIVYKVKFIDSGKTEVVHENRMKLAHNRDLEVGTGTAVNKEATTNHKYQLRSKHEPQAQAAERLEWIGQSDTSSDEEVLIEEHDSDDRETEQLYGTMIEKELRDTLHIPVDGETSMEEGAGEATPAPIVGGAGYVSPTTRSQPGRSSSDEEDVSNDDEEEEVMSEEETETDESEIEGRTSDMEDENKKEVESGELPYLEENEETKTAVEDESGEPKEEITKNIQPDTEKEGRCQEGPTVEQSQLWRSTATGWEESPLEEGKEAPSSGDIHKTKQRPGPTVEQHDSIQSEQSSALRLPFNNKQELGQPFEGELSTRIREADRLFPDIPVKKQQKLRKAFEKAWARKLKAEKKYQMKVELQLPWGEYSVKERNFMTSLEADKEEVSMEASKDRATYSEVRRSARNTKKKDRINGVLCDVAYYNRGMIYDDHYATFSDIAWMRY